MNSISKILFFFNAADRKTMFGIVSCIIVMGCIEMVGIATILPFLAVITKPEVIETNKYLAAVFTLLHFTSVKMFMLFLGCMVFTVLVAGNIFSAVTSWTMMRFCFNQGKKISCQLLKKYLSQPYIFFLNRHSSDLTTNILSEVDRLVLGIFQNCVQSLSKFILVISVLTLLVLVEPLLAFTVMAVLGTAYFITYKFFKRKLMNAGRAASDVNTKRHQIIHEVMGSIKELKILGTEQKFINQYAGNAKDHAEAEAISQIIPLITRYIIESIAFGGMVLIALYLIASKEEISKFMPLLGLYALAGYRLMPAMQQIFNSLTLLKYHFSALEILYCEMQLPNLALQSSGGSKLSYEKCLSLHNVFYHYPNAEQAILSDLSLSITKHSTIGLVGASGAGKTTLVDIILGLLTPTSGQMKIDDIEINDTNIHAWQRNIGYVPQNIFLLDDTIGNNIAFGVEEKEISIAAIEDAARLANLHDFIMQELPQGYQTKIGESGIRLSGGQRQRIGIARALYKDPELLIFDEATSALDGATEKVIMEAINSLAHRKTIILIAHRLNTVKQCDVVYILNKGKIIGCGTYDQLLQTNSAFMHMANAN